ncbi:hypothetical protein OGH69_16655 [Flavobacterium sp. MFBS3-15]|nr:hypothetical protein [Flavobacterium sp. MFBS3-15]MCW4470604.1 hypothetical protein [Flavobacterium sp. MFBS3-15]
MNWWLPMARLDSKFSLSMLTESFFALKKVNSCSAPSLFWKAMSIGV